MEKLIDFLSSKEGSLLTIVSLGIATIGFITGSIYGLKQIYNTKIDEQFSQLLQREEEDTRLDYF